MLLIGLNGRLRSGKDTAYEILSTNPSFNATFQRIGFADKLKLSLVRSLGFNISDPSEAVALANSIKEHGKFTLSYDWPSTNRSMRFTGRQLQQWWGTEGHRDVFGDDFWVDALLPRAAWTRGDLTTAPGGSKSTAHALNQQALTERLGVSDVSVVTDTRFPNEAQRILDLGGEVWKIDADERLGPLPPDVHSSEHGLPDELVTRVIDNNRSLGAFTVHVNQAYMEAVPTLDA